MLTPDMIQQVAGDPQEEVLVRWDAVEKKWFVRFGRNYDRIFRRDEDEFDPEEDFFFGGVPLTRRPRRLDSTPHETEEEK